MNDISEVASLSWTSDDEQEEVVNDLIELNASRMDKESFEAAQTQMTNSIASIRTPMRQSAANHVNPSPHPMQHLASNTRTAGPSTARIAGLSN